MLVDGWVCSDAVVFGVVGDDRVCQVEEIEWDEKLVWARFYLSLIKKRINQIQLVLTFVVSEDEQAWYPRSPLKHHPLVMHLASKEVPEAYQLVEACQVVSMPYPYCRI